MHMVEQKKEVIIKTYGSKCRITEVIYWAIDAVNKIVGQRITGSTNSTI